MKKILAYAATLAALGFGFALYLAPPAYAFPVTSSVVVTVTGFAIPSGTTLGYGLIPFFLPVAIMGLFCLFAYFLRLEGEISSFVIKFSLLIGCLFGMLSLTSSAPVLEAIAFPIASGFFLITYAWKKA